MKQTYNEVGGHSETTSHREIGWWGGLDLEVLSRCAKNDFQEKFGK